MATKAKKSARLGGQQAKLESVLGQVIVARRRELELSQGKLAQRLGVTSGSASKIEAGQLVSLDLVWRLARALELQPSQLIARVEVATNVLAKNGVRVALRREGPSAEVGTELTAAALGGLIGFFLAQK